MNFLPSNYEAPKMGGAYMKIVDGENRIRILSQPIIGWEDWSLERKPIRFRMDAKPEKPVSVDKPIRHFWAFVVWNYADAAIEILEITQANIRKGIEALSKDSDWGAPYFYDIKIVKEGKEMKTRYNVNPMPHKPVTPDIVLAFNSKPCNLEALFDNKDPFEMGQRSYTPGVFSQDASAPLPSARAPSPPSTAKVVTADQALSLKITLEACDPEYKDKVMESFGLVGFGGYEDVTLEVYNKLLPVAMQKRSEYQASKRETVFNELGW